MIQFPKISIVTPNRNGGEYLEQTILSVLNQNYPNLEYIIIDGGSTDNSLEIIRKYEDKLAFWVSEPDKSLYDGIQKGFEKSTGEVMAWLNSDDMYHPGALFTVAEIFASFQEVDWLMGKPSTFDEYGRVVFCGDLKRWSKYDFYLYDYDWVQQESVFWRRKLWVEAGGKVETELKLAGDLELWLRFFRHAKIFVTEALIGGYRARSKNQFSLEQFEKYAEEADKVLKAEKISPDDKRILKKYRSAVFIFKIFRKLNFLDFSSVFLYFKVKLFNYPPVIRFDRLNQRFRIK